MNTALSRKVRKQDTWPRKVQPGREIVTVYRRTLPGGGFNYMLANYASGKRQFDSYASEADALDAADKLARRIDARDGTLARTCPGSRQWSTATPFKPLPRSASP